MLAVIDSIFEYTKDDSAIEKKDLYFITRPGTKRMRETTCGCKLLVLWKYGYQTRVSLKDMKDSQPIYMAEFSKSRGIYKVPAFAWCIP